MSDNDQDSVVVYIGTYTRPEPHVQGKAEGLYVYRLDRASGALEYVDTAGDVVNPSFVAIDPQQRYLYTVNEVADWQGQPSGAVSAFAIDPQRGSLTLLNHQLTHGAAPCHISVDATGSCLLVANYTSGSVSLLPLAEDGRLKPAASVVQHQGAGPHPQRQEGPHAHAILPDPTNRFALVADLGLDKIWVYRLGVESGQLLLHEAPWVELPPGAGPRQLAFHPGGHYLYCVNELDSTLTALAYDAEQGMLEVIQTLSILPAGFAGENWSAAVCVAPSGRFVYASNRGHDSIAVLAIDQASGKLQLLGHVSSGGRTPRDFAIDPSGSYLLAANQDSSSVVVFAIDQESGQLTPTGQTAAVATPVCIRMTRPH